MKIILFGAGEFARQTYGRVEKMPDDIEVLGFVDNDAARWGEFLGKPCFSPGRLKDMEYDKLIILPYMYYEDIKRDLMYWHKVDENKIADYKYLLKLLLTEKYQKSGDAEIQEMLKYWEKNELSVFNQYLKEENEYWEVQWDYIENMPFILFEDKRMYFPYDTKFDEIDGKRVVTDLMSEQQPASPHLYIRDDIRIEAGDVVADAGVCEGNFILRYIEKVSKAYLFEGDRRWRKPLELSMKKFSDKVVLCDKFLGKTDEGNVVTLDSVVQGRLDFLKMDVEGAEPDTLEGGRDTLRNNQVKCAICSYHKSGDEEKIKELLHSYGYSTSVSNGYMVFYHDIEIFSKLDLRRGVVYGRKAK